jgi:LCP family protein required for cell wall assembly
VRAKLTIVLVAVVLCAIGFVGRGLMDGGLSALTTNNTGPIPGGNIPHPNADTPATFTVLLLGVDNRPDQMHEIQRTDTMIVVHINTKTDKVSMMSVPRDTRVMLPGGAGVQKINAAAEFAHSYLGAVAAVNRLLGTSIRYYVVTNFQGFSSIVDTLGGITIDVPQRMVHHGQDANINLEPGVQTLNGPEALQFVRFRDFALGDIGRTEDQQLFLRAVMKKIVSPGSILHLPALVPEIERSVVTNLPLGKLLALALVAHRLSSKNLVTETLPGDYLNVNGISYWYVVPKDAVTDYALLTQGKKVQLFDPAAVQAVTNGDTVVDP